MARRKEFFAAGVPCYVVERGAGDELIFRNDSDRLRYLAIFQEAAASVCLRVLGYCLLPDRTHWIVNPDRPDSLCRCLQTVGTRYTFFRRIRDAGLNPFFLEPHHSALVDDTSVWRSVAQIELAPVRLGLVNRAFAWRWSSAAAHTGFRSADPLLDTDEWSKHWSHSSWSAELDLLEQGLVSLSRKPVHSVAAPPPFPLKENGISPAWPTSLRKPATA